MKANNKLVLVLSTLIGLNVFFGSCVDKFGIGDSFLEKQPGIDVTIDSIFSNAEYARSYLWESYRSMHSAFNDAFALNSATIEALSDCWHSIMGWDDACRYFYNGSLQPGMDWADRYKYNNSDRGTAGGKEFGVWYTTRACWQFIENVDRVPGMDASEKARLKAEAKIIITTRYFDLFRHMGGMPIVRRSYSVEDGDYTNPRATVEETVNFMIELLDDAINTPELPWRIPNDENATWAGRLTRASAMALKAKILLFAASPLFNNDEPYSREEPQESVEKLQVWYGGYRASLWSDCLKACEDFFLENQKNGNYYQLVQPESNTEDGYRLAYRKAYMNRGNSEKLIEVHDHRYHLVEWGQQMPGTVSHMGAFSPTVEFMEMYPYADGRNFDGQEVYNTDNPDNVDIFEGRDPRLYENMVVQKKGFSWQGKQVEIWQGGSMHTTREPVFMGNGFPLYKWIMDYRTITLEPFQWPYLRMGDLHLIYAEALAETGNLPKALDEVNKVRSRVGLPNIETANPQLNLASDKDNLINEILRERACELGFEDARFHDMVRRKLVSDFTKPLHGMKIYRKDGNNKPLEEGEAYPTFRYEEYQISEFARTWWKEGGWSNKWLLKTIPTDEINKDYGLTQNPGW
ncbi:MAG: RagB/SusD family nutrient uptake outer membrane protein [Tannerellaceae bacterium]|jgi:hypothetical protein|nr:RagB/SusD family nutrient uptake outer membrane protein [Tannerellaceae bacterium]